MHTYTSTKAMPYVYMGIHKTTGEFYIGSRHANVRFGRVSLNDLFIYRTSSKIVKPNFDDYDWYIVAEFYGGNDAYDFEQQLIHENWDNPLLLNKSCYHAKSRFKNIKHSDETKQKISEANKGKTLSTETKQKMSAVRKGRIAVNKGRPRSEETKQKISAANRGQKRAPFSEEHKQKISAAMKQLPGHPRSEETRLKMSLAHKGKVLSDEHKQKLSVSHKRNAEKSQSTKTTK